MVQQRRMTRADGLLEPDDWLDMWDAADRVGVPVGELARAARNDALRVRPNPGVNGGLLVSVTALKAWAAAETAGGASSLTTVLSVMSL